MWCVFMCTECETCMSVHHYFYNQMLLCLYKPLSIIAILSPFKPSYFDPTPLLLPKQTNTNLPLLSFFFYNPLMIPYWNKKPNSCTKMLHKLISALLARFYTKSMKSKLPFKPLDLHSFLLLPIIPSSYLFLARQYLLFKIRCSC